MTDSAADDAASPLTRSTIEDERLHALRRYEILDTPPEVPFDRIVRLTARMFGAPVALISFVDRNRQWFKSSVGVAFRETSRDVAFCAHAIQSDEVFVVLDTTKSNLFVFNPLVTGSPGVRFYAGAPLINSEGHRLGALCVMDSAPRSSFSSDDRQALRDLAAFAMDQLETRFYAKFAMSRLDSTRRAGDSLELALRNIQPAIAARQSILMQLEHDLRTPLNAIIGFAEMLEMDLVGPLNRRQRSCIADIRTAGLRMLSVVVGALTGAHAAVDNSRPMAAELHADRNANVIPFAADASLRAAGD